MKGSEDGTPPERGATEGFGDFFLTSPKATIELFSNACVILFHAGLPLKDEQTVGSLPIVNNDQLFLNFFAPYDVPDPDPSQLKAAGGGKKKK